MPHRSRGHGHNRIFRLAAVFAARASAPGTLPDNEDAPGDSVAVILQLAFLRVTPAGLNSDGTVPLLVVADESAVVVAGVRYDALAVQLLAHGVPPVAVILVGGVLAPALPDERVLAAAVARAFAFPLIVVEGVLSLAILFAAAFALPPLAAERVLAPALAGVFGLGLIAAGVALFRVIVVAASFALPQPGAEHVLAPAAAGALDLVRISVGCALAPATAFPVAFALPVPAAEPVLVPAVLGVFGPALIVLGCALAAVVFALLALVAGH